jgi:hypothetical protein
VSEEYIPRREVAIQCNDKIWFDSNIRMEIRKRDLYLKHRPFLYPNKENSKYFWGLE